MKDPDRAAELKKLAHDVRNALNGVAVNLEVARVRAQRGVDVSQLTPFLTSAAQQLDAATALQKRYTDIVAQITASADMQGTRAPRSTVKPVSDNTSSRN